MGHDWRVPNVRGKRAVRHVLYNTNYWKSFVQARLAVAIGDRGCLSLFGQRAERHRLFAEHLTAEYRVRTEGRGRKVDEWKSRPSSRTTTGWTAWSAARWPRRFRNACCLDSIRHKVRHNLVIGSPRCKRSKRG
ncbi:hypothetical protein Mal4_39790 [Maioricimonas rarisocia]|uniref:Uncharacterized protein n=1 Tax=Maioricimonas rarisocia TaxID=2528026 RepID=A0A517ZAV9_9PLAN|nr:terminase gpA endonuclease subunit [Maioricimonas rarisocia]QDU39633.1 hypothetical protein Mal4_39790 [Maioricimonas rarisocia]